MTGKPKNLTQPACRLTVGQNQAMGATVITRIAGLSRRSPDLRGKTSLGWKLMRLVERRGALGGEWRLSLSNGGRFVLPRQAHMAWAIAFRGAYDPECQALVNQYIQPGTLVLDIGASLGLWTVPLGQQARAVGARVWAFEPHPNNHPWLHRNVTINDLTPTVTIHETALGDQVGTVVMNTGEAGHPGAGGNTAVAVGLQAKGACVPIAMLDSFSRDARVSVIKIDVEGYELHVLRGARQLMAKDRPVIFGEFNRIWLDERGEDLLSFLDEIRASGYEVLVVEQLRTRWWRATDRTQLRPLAAGDGAENLLLRPISS
jgi:FkbM family methyltransferase